MYLTNHIWVLILMIWCRENCADKVEADEALQNQDPLYNDDSVQDLLSLCVDIGPLEFDSKKKSMVCPGGEFCIANCNEKRLEHLRAAQVRVAHMSSHLTSFHRTFWPIVVFFIVLLQGSYLFFVKQFNWKTLPFVKGHEFERDPTDGYRYHHFMWMEWIILDSEHPSYYRGMTPETEELEYVPQIQEWENPIALSDEEVHQAWSVRDICDMTADPDDRLEMYFRRVQQQYQLNKPARHGKPQKKKKR